MPAKITERDVARRLIERREDALVEVRRLGGSTVRYRQSAFFDDMAAGGYIATRETIKAKWTMLKADGIIQEHEGATHLDIPRLYFAAGRVCPPKGACRETHRDTETAYIQEASE